MSIAGIFAAGLEAALNRVLDYDPGVRARLAALDGKVLAFDLTGLNVRAWLLPEQGRLRVLAHCELAPDVTLSGSPLAFARLGAEPDTSELLQSGAVRIDGDAELAQRLGAALRGLDIEWEEMAAQLLGDVAAHRLGAGVRAGLDWGRSARARVESNLGEYLQEELRQLPARGEIDDFLREIDRLRADADRLAARAARLARRAAEDAGP